jgi:outer membrane protein TolC
MTMRRIGVMQEFTGVEKRQSRSARAELDAAKTQEEKNSAVATIQKDTAIAWLDRYYAEAMAAVVSDQIAHGKVEIEGADTAYRSGRGTSADILAAYSAQVMLENRASEFIRRINSAKATLARWLGDAAQAPLSGQPMLDSVRLNEQAVEAELAHLPQIAVLARQEDIARADVRVAEANKKSDWTVDINYAVRGSSYSNMASIGFSIPLQWDQKNRQDREVYAKQALVDQATAQKEDVLRMYVAETRAMLAEWQSGRERRDRLQRELVPLASERTEALVGAYRSGKGALTEVLAARRNELDVRLQVLQLEADTARVWAQLNFLFPDDHGTSAHFPRKDLK